MPNARRPGWVVSSFTAPAELLTDAKAAATRRGESLSKAIRRFLESYIRDTD